jgi:hypothetical protein
MEVHYNRPTLGRQDSEKSLFDDLAIREQTSFVGEAIQDASPEMPAWNTACHATGPDLSDWLHPPTTNLTHSPPIFAALTENNAVLYISLQ